MMIRQITQRLHEVNTLLATYGQGVLSFEQALPPSLFYQDFNDTNLLVKEAACLVKENPGQLLDFSSSLLSETNKYLSLDRTPLQTVNFEALFEEYLSPFEHRCLVLILVDCVLKKSCYRLSINVKKQTILS